MEHRRGRCCARNEAHMNRYTTVPPGKSHELPRESENKCVIYCAAPRFTALVRQSVSVY